MVKQRIIWNGIKIAIVLVVLFLLYCVFRDIGFAKILEVMSHVPMRALLISVGLMQSVFLLWAFRLQLIMPEEKRGSIFALYPVYMTGMFGNIITPGARVGGEPIRAYYMAQVFGGAKSGHFGVLMVDKFGNMFVYMMFLLVAVSFVVLYVPLALWIKVVLEMAVLLIVGAVVSGVLLREHIGTQSKFMSWLLRFLYDQPVLRFLRNRFRSYEHFEEYAIDKIDNVFSPVFRAVRSPMVLAKLVVISVVSWLIFYLAYYYLFLALGADVSFFEVFLIVCVSNFCADISFAPGGAGFMEAAMIGMCAAFGVDKGVAAAATLLSRGILHIGALGVGGTSLAVLSLIYGRSPRKSEKT
ncbi:MAG: lysylphosphatidylglycerol synthase transmembrane domain-containing protein [Planctomycetota bacterium]